MQLQENKLIASLCLFTKQFDITPIVSCIYLLKVTHARVASGRLHDGHVYLITYLVVLQADQVFLSQTLRRL